MVQTMFLVDDRFDIAMITVIRKVIANFISIHKERSINGLPMKHLTVIEEVAGCKELPQYI